MDFIENLRGEFILQFLLFFITICLFYGLRKFIFQDNVTLIISILILLIINFYFVKTILELVIFFLKLLKSILRSMGLSFK